MAKIEASNLAFSQPKESGDSSALACLVIVARHRGVHLSVSQLIHDNVLTSSEVTVPQLLKCAQSAKLKAKVVSLTWSGLNHLKKALPAIVTLSNGAQDGATPTDRRDREHPRCAARSERWRRCLARHRSDQVRRGLELERLFSSNETMIFPTKVSHSALGSSRR